MVSHTLYKAAEFPVFGPQYGIPAKTNGNNLPGQISSVILPTGDSDPYEDMFRKADIDIQNAYTESQKASGDFGVENELE
jgi:hypothetical protein